MLRTLSRIFSQTMVQKTGENARSNSGYLLRTVAIYESKIHERINDAFRLQDKTSTAIMRPLRT